jgi:hypothetical protein
MANTEEEVETLRSAGRAEQIRIAREEAWEEGAIWAAIELGAINSPKEVFLVPDDNPHRKITRD